MAKITLPQITSGVSPGSTATPQMNISRPLGASVAGAVGAGLEDVGQALDASSNVLAQNVLKQAAEDNHAAATNALSAFTQANAEQQNSDGGIYTLNGKNAMDGFKPALDQMHALAGKTADSLTNHDQRQLFTDMVGRELDYSTTQMATYTAAQRRKYQVGTYGTAIEVGQNSAYQNRNDPKALQNSFDQIVAAQAALDGYSGVDAATGALNSQKLISETKKDILNRMLGDGDALGAQAKFAEWGPSMMPNDSDAVARAIHVAAEPQLAASDADTALNSVLYGQGATPDATGPQYDQIDRVAAAHGATAEERANLRRTAQIESGGKMVAGRGGHGGTFQFSQQTFNGALPGGDINNPDDQTVAALNLQRQNKAALDRAGLHSTPSNLYLLHQQGPGGVALLEAPIQEPAYQALLPFYKGNATTAIAAIRGNLPASLRDQASTYTAGQFVGYWRQHYNAAGAGGAGGQQGGGLAQQAAQAGEPIDYDRAQGLVLAQVDLQAAQTRPNDIAYRDQAEARALSQLARLKSAQTADQQSAQNRLVSAINGGPDGSGPVIGDIASLQQAYPGAAADLRLLGATAQAKLGHELRTESNQPTAARDDNFNRLYYQSKMEPDTFVNNTNLMNEDLTRTQRMQLLRAQTNTRVHMDQVKAASDNLRSALKDPMIHSSMVGAGLDDPSSDSYRQFGGVILGRIDQYRTNNNGKNPPIDEMRKYVNDAVAGHGFFGTPAYQIPGDVHDRIAAQLKLSLHGRDPSEDEIARVYAHMGGGR